jgi:predicted alpha-1,2-mannosidase
MMQWSPDTLQGVQGGSEPGGYLYSDTQIEGFSFNHLSGAGGFYGSDVGFTPILGNVNSSPVSNGGQNGYLANPSTFSHSNETAVPGYYSVQFNNGIRTELTATTRSGFGRFTYPSGSPATMLINLGSGASIINGSVTINPGNNEISGWTTGFGFLGSGTNHTVYFDVIFDHSFNVFGVWNGSSLSGGGTSASGNQIGAYITFNLSGGGPVLARTAISWVSVGNAQANLQAEIPSSSFSSSGFSSTQTTASNTWNTYLNKIQVSGGTQADTNTFYTMLYHSLLAPSVVSDTNNQYYGFDNSTHTTSGFTKYEYFSGWDIYRNECQLIAMLDPARASDMAQSLVQDAQDAGGMPRWSIATGETGTMLGDPAPAIIAGMYAFGAKDFNTGGALSAMVNAAVNPNVTVDGTHERDDEIDYLTLGFVPENGDGSEGSVSQTLELANSDFAIAQFAQALGDTTDYLAAMKRAQSWRSLFNPATGYIQMKRSDGSWAPGFVIDSAGYDNASAYQEGTAAQYTWMVPFDYSSLVSLMGGPEAVASRLNTFFTQLNEGDTPGDQYAYLGNEPSSETPWIYDFIGEPYQASNVVRQALTQLYSAAPGGLPGNDDLGQTSSWYVWAALGFHPEIPGADVLTLNGPLFPQAVLNLTNGVVTINAAGAADNAPYIESLSVNGVTSNNPWIHFAQIASGGTLDFTVGSGANTNWGSDIATEAPPSYTDGTAINFSGVYEFENLASGLAMNVTGGSTSSGTTIVQWPFSDNDTNSLWSFSPTSDGYYRIANLNSGLFVTVSGASTTSGGGIVQAAADSTGDGEWQPTANPDGTYSFYNRNSGLVLEDPKSSTANSTQLDQWGANGGSNQKFNLKQQPNILPGNYEIQSASNGLALNVSGASTANGGTVVQWPFSSGQTNALWKFVPTSNGYYQIQNVNSGLDVNVTGASTVNGALIVQWSYGTQGNDQWRPVKNADGTYTFYNLNSQLVLEDPGFNNAQGTQYDQWSANGGLNQEFNLVPQ